MGKQQSELISAVRLGDVDRVRKLLERVNASTLSKLIGSARRINVNCADDQGMTALHHAVLTGNTDLVRLLVENGSEVDVIDKRGLRPLHYAAWKGDAATVELLCCHGNGATATVNPSAIDGYTPLHVAAEHGHYNVVERLLRWGADPTRVNDRGRTPLDVACEFGRALVVDLLTNWIPATRLVVTDKNQTTCLHLAARNGHTDVIRILIRAGVDINKQTSRGTCLHEATMFGKADVVRYLLTHGADVNRVNSYEQTALDIVSKFTANRAAHQIEQMLRDTSCASVNTTSQQLRHAMPFSQTCSDLPTSYNFTSRDPIAILSARRLSGSSMDPFARLSESSPVGTMSSDGREYLEYPSSVSYNDIRNGGAGHVNHSRIGASSSPTSSNSSLTSTSFDSPIQTTGGVDLDSVAGSRDDTMAFGGNYKDCDGVYSWLANLQLTEYYDLFAEAGYDMPTISRMTPEDLTAIGITKPSIRKRLKAEIGRLGIRDATPEFHPASVKNLLQLLHIEEYMETLSRQGYNDMDELLDITWEDLEEIGIRKLGHQKKMMLALDRLKRLNRVRTTTSNGTPASFRRSSATSSSMDCAAAGPLHVSVHRTHSAVSDSRRYAVHGARAYPPIAGGNSSSLDYFADRQMSATRMTQQMPFGPAYNHFEGDSSKTLTSSDRYGSVFPERPRSRQAMSSAPSVTFPNSSDACAIRLAGSSMLTTAATMPDIVGRTLVADDDDETSLTSGPAAVSPSTGTRDGEKTPTNAQETHHTPLFAAYCNRQRQLETNFTARAGPNWVVPSASWSGLMQRRIPSTDAATFGGRPSAKVLPSPKPQQSTNGSDFDHHVTDYFRPKTTAEGYHLPAKTTTTNSYSTYATLPRKSNPVNVYRQHDLKHVEDNSNGRPEVPIDTVENGGGRGIPTAQSQTSKAFSEEANRNSKNFVAGEYTRPSSAAAAAPSASSSRSRTMKPTPPKRTNSFKTVPGDEPTDFDDVDARRRRGVPSGSVAGVRRHDSATPADHSARRSVQETPMATVTEPGDRLSASAPSIDESGVAPKRRLEEVVVDSDAGSREQSTMSPSEITLRTSAARRQSTDSGSSSDPTPDGVMPFANEDMGTIKVHRAGITTTTTTGNVASSNADVVHAERHVTFQRPEYVGEYSTETWHRYGNLSDDCEHETGLDQRVTDNGDGGKVCMTSSRIDRCHDNGSAPAIVRSGSSVLLKDIDGMLNGLSLELDMMLQSHT